jgi:transposase
MGAGFPGRQFRPGEKRGTGIGKTKVGKGSKVMVVADGQGLPLGLYITSARHHESWRMPPWPRFACRRDTAVHELARRRGIKPTIPTFERRKRRQPKRGRPIKTGANDRQHWKVERCFGWMDNCRRLVVRYERAVEHYQAFCLIAIILWCVNLILK